MKASKQSKNYEKRLEKFPDTVADKEKAHLMALSEKPYRERATLAKMAASMLKDVALAPSENDVNAAVSSIHTIIESPEPYPVISKTTMLGPEHLKANKEFRAKQRAASLAISTVQQEAQELGGEFDSSTSQDLAVAAIDDLREQNNTWVEEAVKAGEKTGANYNVVDEALEGFK